MVLGALALARPVGTTLGLARFLGFLLVISGVVQLAHSLGVQHVRGRFGRLVLSGLSIVAGALMIRNPVAGAVWLTLVLTFFLLASAVAKGVLAFEIKPARGWGWTAFSAVISAILGVYLIVALPTASLIIPAVFFGVDLIFYGVSILVLGLTSRKLIRERAAREEEISRPRAA